ncbi:hypothetical protein i14_4735 [Escherichia coli str. 'clone D i14']|uniref:Uncharacterized protein n=5 Tax=Enterobacteriaceae TaxID=543 RepID=A0A0H2Z6A8_ECOK1|nr:conserved hypothetical protein [Escherichia coli APEC O1]AER87246.1 hypothetical protein i02_4735 [Escherichia coli str. 'clone D i2']AER92165.1 hypothetical protein i14_4735 [Escherichia coli str. 'clone D i14']
MSPTFTSSGFTSPFSRIRPLPTASTSPRVDLAAAEPVRTMPPADLVSTSLRLTITRSCNGRIFIDNSPLRKSVSVMGDAGAYVVSRLVTREMGMRLRPFKGEKEKKF